MSTTGGIPRQQSDLPNLLAQFWCSSTPETWSSFLGVGLLGAASDGNREGTKQLLLAGANRRKKDQEGLNPLHQASLAGHADVVRELLGDKGETSLGQPQPLGSAQPPFVGGPPSSREGLPSSVGGLPPARGVSSTNSGSGWGLSLSGQCTLSWQSSADGPRLEPSVSFLTKTLVNARDSTGSSPLHLAAARGNTDVVRVLLRNGADVSAADWLERTPLHTAATCAVGNSVGSILLLTQAGADVMARDSVGRSSLHDAACEGAEGAISVLVEAGSKTGARGSICGRTPLHEACARLRRGSVRRLLDLGADEGAADGDGRTPGDLVGKWVSREETVEPGVDACIRGMLAAAPKDRTWRRRRVLLLARWRQQRMQGESTEDGVREAEPEFGELQSVVAFAVHVQEGIFRAIVCYI